MRKKKYISVFIYFILGFIIFVSTAFADIRYQSTYENLVGALKKTLNGLNKNYNSYRLETENIIKVNGKVIYNNAVIEDTDTINYQQIFTNKIFYISHNAEEKKQEEFEIEDIQYKDKSCNLWTEGEICNLENYIDVNNKINIHKNPFNDEIYKVGENIFNSLIGSSKDKILCNENSDGSKNYTLDLNENKISIPIQLVGRYYLDKEELGMRLNDYYMESEVLYEDKIEMKNLNLKVKETNKGVLEKIYVTVYFDCKFKDGRVDKIEMVLLKNIKNINKTKVEKPEVKGKNITIANVEKDGNKAVSKRYIGKWTADIPKIDETKNIVKDGEIIFEIKKIDKGKISGTYYEKYKDKSKNITINFESKRDYYMEEFIFEISDRSIIRFNIYDEYSINISKDNNYGNAQYELRRVLE
ncbi:MAG: hypothetical protein ABF289_02680 [Clostridiales bacterium]